MGAFGGRSFMYQGALAFGGTVNGNLAVTGTVASTGLVTATAGVQAGDAGYAFTAAPTSRLFRSGSELYLQRLNDSVWSTSSTGLKLERGVDHDANAAFGMILRNPIQIRALPVQTINYTQVPVQGGTIIPMNGALLTLTLAASPVADQLVWIKNLAITALIVARNGKTIDGAATDLTVAAGTQVLLHYDSVSGGWLKLSV